VTAGEARQSVEQAIAGVVGERLTDYEVANSLVRTENHARFAGMHDGAIGVSKRLRSLSAAGCGRELEDFPNYEPAVTVAGMTHGKDVRLQPDEHADQGWPRRGCARNGAQDRARARACLERRPSRRWPPTMLCASIILPFTPPGNCWRRRRGSVRDQAGRRSLAGDSPKEDIRRRVAAGQRDAQPSQAWD
jgi:hypothetical protein